MRAQVKQVLARDHPRGADVVDALASFPEMRKAATTVQLLHGDPTRPVRDVLIGHGALTNGGYSVARTCFAHGVLQRLHAEGRGNLIVTGHLAGDSLGFTPFLWSFAGAAWRS